MSHEYTIANFYTGMHGKTVRSFIQMISYCFLTTCYIFMLCYFMLRLKMKILFLLIYWRLVLSFTFIFFQ